MRPAQFTVVALLLSRLGGAAVEIGLEVEEITLANGMRLLVVERPQAPTVAAGWVVHSGSVNEHPGITGAAHFIEHLMFKGTRTIGTTDPEREAEIIARMDPIGDAIRAAATDDDARLPELRAELERLQEAQQALMVPEEFDHIYTANGSSPPNAATSYDLAAFYVTLPANRLELWFWMERDRLTQPVFRELEAERQVIQEERLMVVDADPAGPHLEQFDAMFWTSSPYRHPVIGWPSDLAAVSRSELRRFFTTHYLPGNITAVLVGNVDADRVRDLALAYLEPIPPGAGPPPDVVTTEVEQLQERRMVALAQTTPSVVLRWHTVALGHPDVYALDLLSDILSGRSGRLHRALVEQGGVAVGEPYAVHEPRRLAGLFELGADPAAGATHQEVEDALVAELERIAEEPVTVVELERARNNAIAERLRRMRDDTELMFELLVAAAGGDWREAVEFPARLEAVTADDLTRVVRTHMTAEGLNALWFARPLAPAGTGERGGE
jgi:predicted Zn-dependent peptidase